jgi:hypothetical protein
MSTVPDGLKNILSLFEATGVHTLNPIFILDRFTNSDSGTPQRELLHTAIRLGKYSTVMKRALSGL